MSEKKEGRKFTFSLQRFLGYLGVAMIYPAYAYITAEQKLLKCMDAMTIIGCVFLILGVISSLVRHGDFDIMEYVVNRSLRKKTLKPFGAFKDDKKEERTNSMNYPLLTGAVLLIASGVLALFAY